MWQYKNRENSADTRQYSVYGPCSVYSHESDSAYTTRVTPIIVTVVDTHVTRHFQTNQISIQFNSIQLKQIKFQFNSITKTPHMYGKQKQGHKVTSTHKQGAALSLALPLETTLDSEDG